MHVENDKPIAIIIRNNRYQTSNSFTYVLLSIT